MPTERLLPIASTILSILSCTVVLGSISLDFQDPYTRYSETCAVCHGYGFEGSAQGPPLIEIPLKHGNTVEDITQSIALGIPEMGMPAFAETLPPETIKELALLIAEVRLTGLKETDFFNVKEPISVPKESITSEIYTFTIETVAAGLDPHPYSIAPLPDGKFLVTEKMRGLRIVSQDGSISKRIADIPETYDDTYEMPGIFLHYGTGWLLDVALHPNYEENGWIYLSYGDRCSNCNSMSRTSGTPVSMGKLVRGRIQNDTWIDQETIWEANIETYTPGPDISIGGRITFDGEGHIFLSIGFKGPANYIGIQDLSLPYGKILRLNDDGSIPLDNPYVDTPGALPEIWSFGHRSPQGLEFHVPSGQLWETEMGPKGGDEVNLIEPGKNYGWPLYSKGVNYDGTPVEYGKILGIELDLSTIEHPKVDLTPSPAISSFAFYNGNVFPEWQDNLIVGTLKATELYRMVVEDDQIVHQEKLVDDLARIRDIEIGPQGAIYLLLENASGAQIVRLVR